MTVTNSIREALDSHLAATQNIPIVVYENTPYDQIPDTPHIRVQFLPTSRRPAVRGPNPQNRHQGLYTMTVCIPVEYGTGTGLEIADTLMERFNGSTDVVGMDLTVSLEYSEAEGSFEDEPFYCTPVQVGWYVYN